MYWNQLRSQPQEHLRKEKDGMWNVRAGNVKCVLRTEVLQVLTLWTTTKEHSGVFWDVVKFAILFDRVESWLTLVFYWLLKNQYCNLEVYQPEHEPLSWMWALLGKQWGWTRQNCFYAKQSWGDPFVTSESCVQPDGSLSEPVRAAGGEEQPRLTTMQSPLWAGEDLVCPSAALLLGILFSLTFLWEFECLLA